MRGMNLQGALLELEEGGYLVADEFEKTLVEKLQDENIFRTLATTTQTSSGELKIAVRKDNTGAEWTDEKAKIEKTTLSFDQISIKAHKLATIIQVSEELLNDSFVNIEQMVADDYARRSGRRRKHLSMVMAMANPRLSHAQRCRGWRNNKQRNSNHSGRL